ncbi:hypothetical protein WJX84_006003 [Apatococcus fuscideae]|uniref:Uncharacterized protein n=1 Tax=Apatococcus fuscideae TaxID=2026836 RepID=A0AAW1TA39_9CHLO
MDQPQCICQQDDSSLYGISAGHDSEIVLTLQDSGVHCFNVDRRENSHLWLLGDPSLTFTASAVFDHHKKSLSATVCHTATTRQPGRKDTLITWSADAPAGTLANIAQRSSLPGRAHSLHPLTSAIPPANDQADDAAATPADASMYVVPQQRRGSLVVVFQDGTACAASSFQNGADPSARTASPERVTITACSFEEQLAVCWRPPGTQQTDVHVDIYRSQAGHLQLTSSLQLSAPATGATLASASLQADSLTTTWSTGALQVFSLDSSRSSKQSQPSAEQLMRCSRKLSSSFQQMSEQGVFQHDSSQQHSTPAAAPAPKAFNSLPNGVVKLHLDTPDTKSSKKNKQAKGSGKKRKGGEREAAQPTSTAALPQGSALFASTSLAEGSVALASWENSAPDHQPSVDPTSHNGSLRLSLFDTCYGGVQHSRLLHGLQAPTATARFQVAASRSGRCLTVALNGAVYAAQLQAEPATLASLAGCFGPGSTSEAGQAAQAILDLPASTAVQQSHMRPAWQAAAPAASAEAAEADVAAPLQSMWNPTAAVGPIFQRAQQQFCGQALGPAACTERYHLIASASVATSVVEGFSDQEVCLHPLVAMHHDGTVLLAALSQLSQRQAVMLLRYLLQWMQHHTGLLHHPAAAAAATSSLEGSAIPQYRSILQWLGATLDAHMVSLSMYPACHQVLETLQGMTQQQLEGMDLLVGMRGMLEHIECRAPLPTSQSMAVATYSIEVLDLRVD